MRFIDLHQDLVIYFSKTRTLLQMKRADFRKKQTVGRHADIPTYLETGTKIILASMFSLTHDHGNWKSERPQQEIAKQLKTYRRLTKDHPEFYIIRTARDIERNFHKKNRIGIILHMEGCDAIQKKEDVRRYFDLGVRSFGLTWNLENQHAGGCGTRGGLSEFGKQILHELEKYPVILDLVHLNERSYYDVAGVWKKPFMVSHTALKKFGEHQQDLTDEQVKVAVKRKGIVGLTFLSFLYGKGEITREHAVKHFTVFKKKFGTRALAIGSDYFGLSLNDSIKGLENIEKMPMLADDLKAAGFRKKEIEQVFWKNAYQFIKQQLQ